ncbi:MAG: ABC transporter permease subunit [Lentisphaerae bacterium]|nr:ABC transporter permease subunit [Victivallaceae bacterium]MDD3115769.1 ABC transporter permease subunit [Victivallaceae bacterium]MDD3703952.1 ABC transporter permease subunit [Victivallaceae bacterium]NLK83532.1 ABC transporter permease subunit [Lentisphaerota bacterium]
MGIISAIGRRNIKVRTLIFTLYFILIVGAITMVYPFWLMITGTTKSGVDNTDATLIPQYLYDDNALYRKAIEGIFNEKLPSAQIVYNLPITEFRTLEPPPKNRDKFVRAWEAFLEEKEFPFYYFMLGYSEVTVSRNSCPANLRSFKNVMYDRYKGDINALNTDAGTDFVAWPNFIIRETTHENRRMMPNIRAPIMVEWYKFKDASPIHERVFSTASGYYNTGFLQPQFSRDITSYNKTHKTNYASYSDIVLSRFYPKHKTATERRDWEFFVRNVLNLLWVRVDASALNDFHSFLQIKYQNIDGLNQVYGSKYQSFDDIPLVERVPFSGVILADWSNFVQGWEDPTSRKIYSAPAESLSISSIEFDFQDYLKDKFGSIEAMNKHCVTHYNSFEEIYPPQQEYHYQKIITHKALLRYEFTVRNFITVIDYILLHGRGIYNTAVYCFLAVLCALIVNPLAAYALSRFQPPSTYKILLFLMLTMAFPQMVTQIPNFLMLRELGLLNTFGALILPTLANGYQIFLLKGFFDSLPRELYESAMLDGASETRIFLQLTMNLSKPILAVIALQAFTQAYSNFMMAMLICQDRDMWTIMPWLYQLQMSSCEGIIYASLIVASIPTFLIFMLCQNVIIRGIIVPVEK